MSALAEVIERSVDNTGLIERALTDPNAVAAEYGLSMKERDALASGDEERIREAAGLRAQANYVVAVY